MEVLLCIVGQLSSLNPGYLPQARLESSQVPFAQAVIRRTLSSTVCTLARPQDKVETSMGSEALHAIPALAVNRLFVNECQNQCHKAILCFLLGFSEFYSYISFISTF